MNVVIPAPSQYHQLNFLLGFIFLFAAGGVLFINGINTPEKIVLISLSIFISIAFFVYGKRLQKSYRLQLEGHKIYQTVAKLSSQEVLNEKNSMQIIEKIEKAYKLYPVLEVRHLLGICYYFAKDYKKSSEILSEFISGSLLNQFQYCQALSNISPVEALDKLDELPEMFEVSKSSLLHMKWYELRASAYIDLELYDKAGDIIKTGLSKRHEDYTEGKRELKKLEVNMLRRMKDYKAADKKLLKILKENPNNHEASELLENKSKYFMTEMLIL